jgi:hypothetical protein
MLSGKNRITNLVTLGLALLALVVVIALVRRLEIPASRIGAQLEQTASPRVSQRGASVLGLDEGFQRGRDPGLTALEKDQLALSNAKNKIQIGVFAMNNYDLDLSAPGFSSSGLIWVIWEEPLEAFMRAQNLRIQDIIQPVNLLESGASESFAKATGEPQRIGDSRFKQVFNYHGRFKIDQLHLRRFPFNSLTLPLIFEARDPTGGLDYTNARLLPDTGGSGLGQLKDINGWINEGWSVAEFRQSYDSTFGNMEMAPPRQFSQVVFEAIYRTSTWGSFWRLIQPLAVVLLMLTLVAKVDRKEWETRVGAPTTVVLTLIFLQQEYRGSVPIMPSLTFLDKLYIFAYLVSLATFVLSIWSCRRDYLAVNTIADPVLRSAELRRLDRIDALFAPITILSALIFTLLAWSF